MLPKFLSYLNEEKNRRTEIYNQFIDDSFLSPIQTKFVSLNLSGGNNTADKIGSETQSGGTQSGGTQSGGTQSGEAQSGRTTHSITASDFESIYHKVNGLVGVLKNRSYDVIVQMVRYIFFLDMEKYLKEMIDLENSQYFLYTTLSTYHRIDPFFPNRTFIINDINSTKTQTTVVIINLATKESTDNFGAIVDLLHHILDANVPTGGNLILYFFFAPWIEEHISNVIECLVNNFEQVTVLFPLIFLPISNKCFYMCKNKLDIPTKSKLNHNVYNQSISFSKQVAFHVLNDLNILISLLNFKIDSEETFEIISNKIKSHIYNLPVVKDHSEVKITKF